MPSSGGEIVLVTNRKTPVYASQARVTRLTLRSQRHSRGLSYSPRLSDGSGDQRSDRCHQTDTDSVVSAATPHIESPVVLVVLLLNCAPPLPTMMWDR